MSKDIWHKADETPKAERYFIEHYKVVVGDKVYWKYGLFKGVSNYDYPFDQDTARWCYLDDLLALEGELEQSEICCTEWEKQALDYKAENIALSGDLERTRKALEIIKKELDIRKKQVEIANKAFDFISTEWDNVDCSRKELGACAFNAQEDIAGWKSDIETAEQKDK